MSGDLYVSYLQKCLGRAMEESETWALSGAEVVEALWPLNDRFQPLLHRIASLPYDVAFEKEADDAIEALVFNQDDWSAVSAQAWRVLLERQQQAIILFQLQANEPIVPIPSALNPRHYAGAAMLFVLHQWKLPLPIADRSALAGPASTVPGSLKSH
jgi:hypothetical protein